jgi:hypothetical protein
MSSRFAAGALLLGCAASPVPHSPYPIPDVLDPGVEQ